MHFALITEMPRCLLETVALVQSAFSLTGLGNELGQTDHALPRTLRPVATLSFPHIGDICQSIAVLLDLG